VTIAIRREARTGWIVVIVSGPIDIDEMVETIRTVRASVHTRMVPMLVDARDAIGPMSAEGIEQLVAAVQDALKRGGLRGHVAIVASDDAVYAGMLQYEARCAGIGVRVIRVFRQMSDAERWLEILSAARDFRS
jgi:hypothetical protein